MDTLKQPEADRKMILQLRDIVLVYSSSTYHKAEFAAIRLLVHSDEWGKDRQHVDAGIRLVHLHGNQCNNDTDFAGFPDKGLVLDLVLRHSCPRQRLKNIYCF
jgi:hypothetical protein